MTNESKPAVTAKNEIKPGQGYLYDDADLNYHQEFDPLTGAPIFYDSIGVTPTPSNESKLSASASNEAKP